MTDSHARADTVMDFYKGRVHAHGLSYQAQWGDDADWKARVRFAPLLSLPLADSDVIVDIGCGTANLAGFLRDAYPGLEYIGVELVGEFAAEARAAQGVTVVEMDGFGEPDALPSADWYVTFGALNKEWCLKGLPGATCEAKVTTLLTKLFARAAKGVAASMVTTEVEYRKDDVCYVDPARLARTLADLSPHFAIYHGYPMYEFFASVWRGHR